MDRGVGNPVGPAPLFPETSRVQGSTQHTVARQHCRYSRYGDRGTGVRFSLDLVVIPTLL